MDAPPPLERRIASRTVQVLLAAVVMAGASRDVMATLPLYGVAILVVPPVLGRLCRHRFGPIQRLWFAVGLSIHPVGAIYGLYRSVWWYDHFAHAASASLLAGLAYLVVASLVADGRLRDLPSAAHVGVLAVVLCSGVAWELLELQVDYLHVAGPKDTLADMTYNVVGWLAVAPRGNALLGDLSRRLSGRLEPSGPQRWRRPSRFSRLPCNRRYRPDGPHQAHHPLHRRGPRR